MFGMFNKKPMTKTNPKIEKAKEWEIVAARLAIKLWSSQWKETKRYSKFSAYIHKEISELSKKISQETAEEERERIAVEISCYAGINDIQTKDLLKIVKKVV